jgi:transketolase N-terminal domain/subunit
VEASAFGWEGVRAKGGRASSLLSAAERNETVRAPKLVLEQRGQSCLREEVNVSNLFTH